MAATARWANETSRVDRTRTAPLAGDRDVLLVDEAGMLDQDTALAVLTIADQYRGPRRPDGRSPPAPSGGSRGSARPRRRRRPPAAQLTLEVVHRFEDPAYADLSLLMRRGERTGEVFDAR